MLTEECQLNPFLERHGIEVIDTDLGERIVQLANEPPSHIVMPCIHYKREEIGDLFHKHLGTEAGAKDPKYLAEAARQHLREKFLGADAGITGVNFCSRRDRRTRCSVRTRGMQTSVHHCQSCISRVWESKSSFREQKTLVCFFAYLLVLPPVSRSRHLAHTSMVLEKT